MSADNKRHPVPIVAHPAYTEALELAFTHINRADPGTLLLVVGMSGAGKNTLSDELENRIVTRNPILRDGEKPLVKVVAANTNNAFYASKDAASRLVDALEDPFLSTTRSFLLAPFSVKVAQSSHRSVSESTLRRTAARLLVARNTRYLFVDEADMMCVIKKSGRDAADHLESWRLLALEAAIVIVLMGTYRILTIWDRTSQFTRKMPTVHLRRYIETDEADVKAFVGILNQLCEIFKVEVEGTQEILAQARSILAATGGIFGQLLALFQRADDIAEASGRSALTLSDVKQSLPRKHQVAKLWNEIIDGERRLEASDFESVISAARVARALASGKRLDETTLEASSDSRRKASSTVLPRKRGRPKGSKNRRAVRR